MKTVNKVGFHLAKINTIQFATIDTQIEDNAEIDIQANIDFGINTESKRILCITKFEFQIAATPFIILEANCEFQLDDSTWESLCGKSDIEIPKGLLQHLSVITIGTVRGILHAKTENTDYNKFFVPTLNVSNMLKEDLKFPLM